MPETTRTLAEVKDDLRKVRAEVRLAEAQAQKRLLENWLGPSLTGSGWGSFVDQSDRLRFDGLQAAGWALWDRKAGPNPLLTDEAWLERSRGHARQLATTNPLAIGVLEALVDFVVGDGFSYRGTSKDRANAELVAQVQDVVDLHLEDNDWPQLEPELLVRSRRDGEYLLRYFREPGRLDVRTVEPEQMRNPPRGTLAEGWRCGIRYALEDGKLDVFTPVEYSVWYDGQAEPDLVPADQIDHVKCNVDRSLPRGLSDFLPTGDILQETLRLLQNMRTGEGVRAAIVGFYEYETASRQGVQDAIDKAKDALQPGITNPVTGKEANYEQALPGTIKHVPRGKKFIAPPVSPNAAAQTAVVQASLRSAGARWGMPEYVVSGDASNANYASTLVAGSPFARRIKRAQRLYKQHWRASVWRAVEWAVLEGRLPAEALELVTLQVEAPIPEQENQLEQAHVDDLDIRNGVLSKQTRRQRRGLDDEQERVNIAAEPLVPPPAPERVTARVDATRGGRGGFFPRLGAQATT